MSETQATETSEQTSGTQPADTAKDIQQKADVIAEQKAEEKRKYKLKVNGSEKEYDEDAVIAHAQRGLAADEKFRTAAQARAEAEKLTNLAKKDPEAFFKALGMDIEEVSKATLSKKLAELSMDPKEREINELKRKLELHEKEKQEQKEAEEKAKTEKATEFWSEKYDKELPEAIKAAGLPLTKEVIVMTADLMIASLEEGVDLPLNVVMDMVKEKHLSSVKNFLTGADKEKLVSLLGPELVDSLIAIKSQKKDTKKEETKLPVSQKKAVGDRTKSEKENMKDLDEYIKEWAKQG